MKLDLTKPQIISGDVKVLVRDREGEEWEERYLLCIYEEHDNLYYRCWPNGKKGEDLAFKVTISTAWKQCKHIPNKRNMTQREIIGFLSHKKEPFLVCKKDSENLDFDAYENYSRQHDFHFKDIDYTYYYREINEKGEFTSEPIPLTIEEEA